MKFTVLTILMTISVVSAARWSDAFLEARKDDCPGCTCYLSTKQKKT